MLANSGSNRSYESIGVRGDHHDVSHHDHDEDKLTNYAAIARWQIDQFAYVVKRLGELHEGGERLIDRTLLYFSSEISDGDKHDHVNLPVFLAGRAGGAMRTGFHLRARDQRPLGDLYLTIARAFGVAVSSFGDGTEPIAELLP
jgi:hypothetical protein